MFLYFSISMFYLSYFKWLYCVCPPFLKLSSFFLESRVMLCMYTLYFKRCTLYKFIEINSVQFYNVYYGYLCHTCSPSHTVLLSVLSLGYMCRSCGHPRTTPGRIHLPPGRIWHHHLRPYSTCHSHSRTSGNTSLEKTQPPQTPGSVIEKEYTVKYVVRSHC